MTSWAVNLQNQPEEIELPTPPWKHWMVQDGRRIRHFDCVELCRPNGSATYPAFNSFYIWVEVTQ